jgi:DnaJ-class molecular chaperone
MSDKKVCPTCHGNGYLYVDIHKTIVKSCSRCKGQGEVKK